MPEPRTLSEVMADGDLRGSLEALRDTLAGEIEMGTICKACGGTGVSATAPLAKQLADVLKALAALPTGEERSIEDELADRRRQVGGASPDSRQRSKDAAVDGRGRGASGRNRRAGAR